MDLCIKQNFLERWSKYFPNTELPIIFYYTDRDDLPGKPEPGAHCIMAQLGRARKGFPLYLDLESTDCAGGKRYLGFKQTLRPNFNYFLSCGIEGELEGERYKLSPELVDEQMKHQLPFHAPAKGILFKRWDNLVAEDEPLAVIFFAALDVLSGLFTLANFDASDPNTVIAPMGSGCSSIVYYPYQESLSPRPHAILGMFDPSARPYVPAGQLTLTFPWALFIRMLANMDESFLITPTWDKIKTRIAKNSSDS
jgi:hypothetical protein